MTGVVTGNGARHDPQEKAVARLWANAGSVPAWIVTEDGARLKVVYAGRPSSKAGPDFRDCVLVNEAGERIEGDVEVHLDEDGWRRHGHHRDPSYNGVVLHLVFHQSRRSSTAHSSGTTAPVALISSLTTIGPAGTGPAPAGTVAGGPAAVLDAAGDARFLARSKGLAGDIERLGQDQAAYAAFMDSMGFAGNRKAFGDLSARANYRLLSTLAAEPAETRLLAAQSLLLKTAGLMHRVEDPSLVRRLAGIAPFLPRSRAMRDDAWHTFLVRPANHPARRLVGVACVVDRSFKSGFAETILQAAVSGAPASVRASLQAEPWIGAGKAAESAVNVALPFAHTMGSLRRDAGLQAKAIAAYRGFPAPAENEITREARVIVERRLGPVEVKTARRAQGLIHLYRGYVASGAMAGRAGQALASPGAAPI
ncbi:MAG: DUF2851 family protein [SAR202 cluster bacterium]|nr:DUF2851 family protein [SAR202 cluster bacterium]